MKVAVMQPTYLPWMGYFDLMDQVDTFVLLDDVQFSKQSWQQRNRIKTAQGLTWLSVPVLTKGRNGQRISDVQTSDQHFVTKHVKSIEQSYCNAPGFADFMPAIKAAYDANQHSLLALNHALINCVRDALGIETPVLSSTDIEVRDERRYRVADICQSLGATTYISPLGALSYLVEDSGAFEEVGIGLCFHRYDHPTYAQPYPPFTASAAAIDLVFNTGPQALSTLRSGRAESYTFAEALAQKELDK
jgi:hypothetical protein